MTLVSGRAECGHKRAGSSPSGVVDDAPEITAQLLQLSAVRVRDDAVGANEVGLSDDALTEIVIALKGRPLIDMTDPDSGCGRRAQVMQVM
jgi:hypothetical protein